MNEETNHFCLDKEAKKVFEEFVRENDDDHETVRISCYNCFWHRSSQKLCAEEFFHSHEVQWNSAQPTSKGTAQNMLVVVSFWE